MFVQSKAVVKSKKIAGQFLKATIDPTVFLLKCKTKFTVISWAAHRFKKHMVAKRKFTKEFLTQWQAFMNEKIREEIDTGKISQTAKIFVSAQSWLLKNLAEHLFDIQIQKKVLGKFNFPKRNFWVSEEIESYKNKKSFSSTEKATQREVAESPITISAFDSPKKTDFSIKKLATLKEESESHAKKCKKCKRNHQNGEKCEKKKLKILRAPSSKRSPEKKNKTVQSFAKTSSSLELNQMQSKPLKKKTMITLRWLADGMEKMLTKKKIRLKTLFIAAIVISRITLAIENRYFTPKYRIIRKLQPKPYFQHKLTCNLKRPDFDFYLGLLASRIAKTNQKSKLIF